MILKPQHRVQQPFASDVFQMSDFMILHWAYHRTIIIFTQGCIRLEMLIINKYKHYHHDKRMKTR